MVNAEWPEKPFRRDVEACISLHNGHIELTSIGSDNTLAGDGHLGYGWHRGLHVDIEKPTTRMLPDMGVAARLAIPDLNANCEVFLTREQHRLGEREATVLYEGVLSEPPLVWSRGPAYEVRFDIAGLTQTIMLRESEAHWHGTTRRLVLEAGRWQVKIVELEDARERRAEAQRSGKGAITPTRPVFQTQTGIRSRARTCQRYCTRSPGSSASRAERGSRSSGQPVSTRTGIQFGDAGGNLGGAHLRAGAGSEPNIQRPFA